jgi:hypothetical protein
MLRLGELNLDDKIMCIREVMVPSLWLRFSAFVIAKMREA